MTGEWDCEMKVRDTGESQGLVSDEEANFSGM